ncbi:uncharacterized protein BDZ99DRAFT_299264 [Mytilinidion resinicola]|uniref:Uncharacterized protein n=1 Tax=Mytilinidion resinicola TaxID=574789 RepID=A0A6A6YMW4_9PEZI|nr:uncharacterized protein BDZ99DRAFT_299264 [Mytilinidion resinicola]KAF2809888.1 hypothetical protein BDZ99DRAFT_299264 [Mytilinidion resinicola]
MAEFTTMSSFPHPTLPPSGYDIECLTPQPQPLPLPLPLLLCRLSPPSPNSRGRQCYIPPARLPKRPRAPISVAGVPRFAGGGHVDYTATRGRGCDSGGTRRSGRIGIEKEGDDEAARRWRVPGACDTTEEKGEGSEWEDVKGAG